jgi:hypothetical protein
MNTIRLLVCFAAVALAEGGPPSPKAKDLSASDLAFFVQCARSSAYDMMGRNYASGDNIRVKYLFSGLGANRPGERLLYIAVLAKSGAFGRLFQLVHDGRQWTVSNDADIRTRPKWALTSDPLGGGTVMERALRKLESESAVTVLRIGPIGSQPSGCRTYAQGFGKQH